VSDIVLPLACRDLRIPARGHRAKGRILSDGVCNAYLVDIWTATRCRRRGDGGEVVNRPIATVAGQHVGLFTDDRADFHAALGFRTQGGGMSSVIGSWLGRGE